ncbi:AhpC-TSA-domain-containing protein [Cylindrobasidium torrendii FP15055 ss-10]|uniref:thioredoxin-dependent peroxiredoxin n=1 Tax=Cylindrobasidium torrendii FP15055 ss-10 TaxID=1314674 RepID=A0A0D7BEJ7_9AGAR|nr:AhpC-TSA-domain-containing protein [Cylindrobasidium torrendii FP15055 ss-10]
MPPRTKKDTEEPTRRSSRIKSAPVAEAPAAEVPKKKRTADGEGEGAANTKKVRVPSLCSIPPQISQFFSPSHGEDPEEGPGLNIGDHLPDITVQNEKGEDVSVKDLAAETGVVLFLVPRADTPGCTTQACAFRDDYTQFSDTHYAVYCLSADSPGAQTKWQAKKNLPYGLLSDPKRTLISALGAGAGGKTKRSHFVFEKGGKLVAKKMPVKPADSPKLALEAIKELGSGKA